MRLKTRNKATCILLGIFLLSLISTAGFAQIPQTVSYQGFLTDSGGAPVDTTVSITFKIYNVDLGGIPLWTDTQSVDVNQGVYSVTFESTPANPFPPSMTFNIEYFLGVQVGADAEMTPRQAFTAVPYALNADRVDGKDSTDLQICRRRYSHKRL